MVGQTAMWNTSFHLRRKQLFQLYILVAQLNSVRIAEPYEKTTTTKMHFRLSSARVAWDKAHHCPSNARIICFVFLLLKY